MEAFFTRPSSCSVYSIASALGFIVGIIHHLFFQYPRQADLLTVLYFCFAINLVFVVGRIRSATSHWGVSVELALFNAAYVSFQLLWLTLGLDGAWSENHLQCLLSASKHPNKILLGSNRPGLLE